MKRLPLLALLLFPCALAQETAPTQPQDPSAVVATIAGQNITLEQFEAAFRQRVGRILNNQGMPYDEDMLELFNRYRPEILEEIVNDRRLFALAERSGTALDTEAYERYLSDIREDFDTEEALERALGQSGFASWEAFEADVRERFIVGSYLERTRGRFNFSDTVLQGYYSANRQQFAREPQACVRHILVKTEEDVRAVRAALAERSFAEVAEEYSQDPGSKGRGGELGCFEPGVTVPEFDRASFGAPLNTLQEVETQFGLHLLTVYDRKDAGLRPFEEVKEAILGRFREDAVNRYLDSQLARVSSEAFPERVRVALEEE